MKKIMLFLVLAGAGTLFAGTSLPEGWLDDHDAALKKAAEENKLVFADFTGSDWCHFCKRFAENIIDTDEFRAGMKDRYVLLYLDTPSDSSLVSDAVREQNRKLMMKHAVQGFPTFIVLDAKGEEVARLANDPDETDPKAFLARLNAEVALAPEIRRFIKPIEETLKRHSDDFRKEMEAAAAEVAKRFPRPDAKAAKKEMKKFVREYSKAMEAEIFGKIAPRFLPMFERNFEEAKAMKVPAGLEERKSALIKASETGLAAFRQQLARYEEAKKNPPPEPEEEEDGE